MVDVVIDTKTKVKKVNGKPKELKKSGEYPLQFGLAVSSLISPDGLPSSSADKG